MGRRLSTDELGRMMGVTGPLPSSYAMTWGHKQVALGRVCSGRGLSWPFLEALCISMLLCQEGVHTAHMNQLSHTQHNCNTSFWEGQLQSARFMSLLQSVFMLFMKGKYFKDIYYASGSFSLILVFSLFSFPNLLPIFRLVRVSTHLCSSSLSAAPSCPHGTVAASWGQELGVFSSALWHRDSVAIWQGEWNSKYSLILPSSTALPSAILCPSCTLSRMWWLTLAYSLRIQPCSKSFVVFPPQLLLEKNLLSFCAP